MAYPKDYKYTKEHEWIQVSGTTGTVGITDHAQESLGDIVFVELPKVGAQLQSGKSFGTVESVKAVSELYAPASGKVTAVNDALNQSPEDINKNAHSRTPLRPMVFFRRTITRSTWRKKNKPTTETRRNLGKLVIV
jgi:glycine cleavage system H protein